MLEKIDKNNEKIDNNNIILLEKIDKVNEQSISFYKELKQDYEKLNTSINQRFDSLYNLIFNLLNTKLNIYPNNDKNDKAA